jgi:hypothetical protein
MRDMGNHERRAAYASLWVLALAFGWIEASAVVYLREIYVRELSLQGSNYVAGLPITLVSLPGHLFGRGDDARGVHHSPARGGRVVGTVP